MAILVGLSYAKNEKAIGANRETGGASVYLGFKKSEVIPLFERQYRADSQRRMLVGQSFGGFFGVYALLKQPGLSQG